MIRKSHHHHHHHLLILIGISPFLRGSTIITRSWRGIIIIGLACELLGTQTERKVAGNARERSELLASLCYKKPEAIVNKCVLDIRDVSAIYLRLNGLRFACHGHIFASASCVEGRMRPSPWCSNNRIGHWYFYFLSLNRNDWLPQLDDAQQWRETGIISVVKIIGPEWLKCLISVLVVKFNG